MLVSILSVVSTTVTGCTASDDSKTVVIGAVVDTALVGAGLVTGRVVVATFDTIFSELLIVDESPLKKVVKNVNVVNIVLTSKSSDPIEG